MTKHYQKNIQLTAVDTGKRLDVVLACYLSEFSRSQIIKWITSGAIRLNGAQAKPKQKVKGTEIVNIEVTYEDHDNWQPENLPINIIYQDDDIAVIDKPANLVVHPGAGNPNQTLVNALLFHFEDNRLLPRAGIVHRLDKDTSGLLLVAKSVPAYTALVQAMQQRQIKRHYTALVYGEVTELMSINEPIGRSKKNRLKMAVVPDGKVAVTHITSIEPLDGTLSLLTLQLETGRTHQIRVHLSHLGFPLVGDQTYTPTHYAEQYKHHHELDFNNLISRQVLHAHELSLDHPITQHALTFHSPLPKELQHLLDGLNR